MDSIGKDAYLALGSNGAVTTKTNRSTYFDSFDFPMDLDEVETTTFGGTGDKTYIPGLSGKEFSASGNHDATIDGHLYGIHNGKDTVDFDYCPIANSSGNVKYSGSFFLKSYAVNVSSPGETVTFSATFRIVGAVTRVIV